MKTAFIFPGQGSQFVSMAKTLIEKYPSTIHTFKRANEVLGWDILQTMSEGTAEDLQQTKVTQNAIFIYSVATLELLKGKITISATAGHSLGEFTSLVAAHVLRFEDALLLVNARALAMQKACEAQPSTMAAVLGLEDRIIQEICQQINAEIVVPANYNCQGQVVISGTLQGIEIAKELLVKAGAKRVLPLSVGGAFHSPLMLPAQEELKNYILKTSFNTPSCPIYQNVVAKGITNTAELQENLISQLTGSVKWTQTIQQMQQDGVEQFVEVGPGKVLQGLVAKIAPSVKASSWEAFL